jgi:acetyltransferase-like isoleucine patch superfamily enzyme
LDIFTVTIAGRKKMNLKPLLRSLLEKIFFGILRMVVPLFDNSLTKSIGFIYRRAYWKTKLKYLGTDVLIYSNVVINSPDKVSIGDHCSMAEFVHIWGSCGVTIGNNVGLGSKVSITSAGHSPDADIWKNSLILKPVIIEDNVMIGTHAIILPGVTIKRGSSVAAGAVVTRDVPKDVIVAGVPARIIRQINRSNSE